MKTKKIELPENYLEIIERFLPNYYSSRDVSHSDILSKFIDGELEDEKQLSMLKNDWGVKSIKDAEKLLLEIDTKLYLEAVENSKIQ